MLLRVEHSPILPLSTLYGKLKPLTRILTEISGGDTTSQLTHQTKRVLVNINEIQKKHSEQLAVQKAHSMGTQRALLLANTQRRLSEISGFRERAACTGLEVTDACVVRFCDASKWREADKKEIWERIVETVEWREIQGMDRSNRFKSARISPYIDVHHPSSCSSAGAIIVVNPTKENIAAEDLFMNELWSAFELAISGMPQPDAFDTSHKWAVVLNCREIPCPSFAWAHRLMYSLQWHYPRRLQRVYVVDASFAWRMLWTTASAFIPQRQSQKIVFVTSEEGVHGSGLKDFSSGHDLPEIGVVVA